MSDYRVNVKVTNARIRRAMEAAGYDSVIKLCDDHGMDYGPVYELLNMKKSPVDRHYQWRGIVLKLADALNVLPDDLFSENQKTFTLKTNSGKKDVTENEVMKLVADVAWNERITDQQENAGFRMIADEQADKILEDTFMILNERQKFIVKALSGMLDGTPWTAEQIAEKLDISIARVFKVHNDALYKMRHSKNGPHLADAANDLGIRTERYRYWNYLMED